MIAYILVKWPESQEFMDNPRFTECLFLNYTEGGVQDVGPSAYMVPLDLYLEVTNQSVNFQHDLVCNANPRTIIGGDMCSCVNRRYPKPEEVKHYHHTDIMCRASDTTPLGGPGCCCYD